MEHVDNYAKSIDAEDDLENIRQYMIGAINEHRASIEEEQGSDKPVVEPRNLISHLIHLHHHE